MIDKKNIANLYRLSPLQGGMLFHTLYNAEGRPYFEQMVYRIEGELDPELFEQGWNGVVERHDALRTAFIYKGVPEPLQVVLRSRPIPFTFEDYSDLEEEELAERVDAYRGRERKKGFDLTNDPLLRIALFRIASDRHLMVMTFHHIIMDGWCQHIIGSEFTEIYSALKRGEKPSLPPAPQFREYIRWIEAEKKANGDGMALWWKDYLDQFGGVTDFPARATTADIGRRENRQVEDERFLHRETTIRFELGRELTASLEKFVSTNGITISTFLQTVWGLLLGQMNQTNDALLLATVSGRPDGLRNAGSIVGLFINALPVRVRFDREESFASLLQSMQIASGESQPYHATPLVDIQQLIQNQSRTAEASRGGDLCNLLLVIENYPEFDTIHDLPFQFSTIAVEEESNYDLTVQIHPGENLAGDLVFKTSRIDPALVESVIEVLRASVRSIVEQHDLRIAEVLDGPMKVLEGVAFDSESAQVDSNSRVSAPDSHKAEDHLSVLIASTCTLDPVEPWVDWWLKEMGREGGVTIAPYNQIFQQLLDPGSEFHSMDASRSYALLATRFDDWVGDRDESTNDLINHLEKTYNDYLQAIDQFRGNATLLHLLLPSDRSTLDPSLCSRLEELDDRIVEAGRQHQSLLVIDGRTLADDFLIDEPFDPVADRAGHIPYSQEFFRAIGTTIARALITQNQHPFKVIAVDCDDTLWDGICGEVGPTGVTVTEEFRQMQQFLIDRYNEGFLIVLNSKNNEQDVIDVFEKNPGMILTLEHVVGYRVNWQAKSLNLKELAEELNLGLNSFIFIDDSAMETAEVMENAPEVLTLRRPVDVAAFPRFLRHLWGLDKWKVTDEDRNRSRMYAAEQRRKENQEKSESLDDFLASLDVRIVMAPVGERQIARFSQLTQRTNQFNISTIRRDEGDVRELLANSGDDATPCWIVSVQDRFGEYGLVGDVICRPFSADDLPESELASELADAFPNERLLLLDTLLLSCRVLARGVEQAIMAGLRSYAVENGYDRIVARYLPTAKNRPALDFLESWPERYDSTAGESNVENVERENEVVYFHRHVSTLPTDISHGQFEFRSEPIVSESKGPESSRSESDARSRTDSHSNTPLQPPLQPDALTVANKEGTSTSGVEGAQKAQTKRSHADWNIDPESISQLYHAAYYLPLIFASSDGLKSLPANQSLSGTGAAGNESGRAADAVRMPSSLEEKQLADIYCSVLKVDAIGMDQNFFELGGNSLNAIELLSNVYRQFGVEVSLRQIFEHPTPAELLDVLNLESETVDQAFEPIPVLPPADDYPLSFAQRRLWLLDSLQESVGYMLGGTVKVEGELSADALERSFRLLIARHESLRTSISLAGTEPRQSIADVAEAADHFAIEQIDLSEYGDLYSDREARGVEIITERQKRPFDLAAPPLMRVVLINLGDGVRLLTMIFHHIIIDGWSYTLLLEELSRYYGAIVRGETFDPPAAASVQYKEYSVWQRHRLESSSAADDEAFWANELASPLPRLNLPTDRPRPVTGLYSGDRVSVSIPADLHVALLDLVGEEEGTFFMGLVATLRLILWQYTGDREVILGTPVAGRDHPDLAELIGFFVNTLALRDRINPSSTFRQLLSQTKERILQAFEHRETPFDLLVGKLEHLDRAIGRAPVFDVMVVLQNNRSAVGTFDDLMFEGFGQELGAGTFDLVFNFSQEMNGENQSGVPDLQCDIEYRTELFDRSRIEKIGSDLVEVIRILTEHPDRPILEGLCDVDELQHRLSQLQSATSVSPDETIVSRFLSVASQKQSSVAITEGEHSITWSDLAQRTEHIAAGLVAQNLKPGDPVISLMQSRLDAIVLALGIMRAGGVYVPIDPSHPAERIGLLAGGAGSGLVITGCKLTNALQEILHEKIPNISILHAQSLFEIEQASTTVEGGPELHLDHHPDYHAVNAGSPAYIIFTSGSTGRPKGVRVSHGSFLNMISRQIETFDVRSDDTVLQFSSLGFDASLSEIFMALLSGASLIVATRSDLIDIEMFPHFLEQNRITVATIPPVYLRNLGRRHLTSLRVLITAGEEAPAEEVLFHARRPMYPIAVFNAYGPTEAAVCTTIFHVDGNREYPNGIPIGRSIDGMEVVIIDEDGMPLPEGVPGELVLFGVGLADGYLEGSASKPSGELDGSLTKGAFPRLSWSNGLRCYRTGDQGYFLPDGNIMFLGRIDNQVKIRGHRVEPEELRAAILSILQTGQHDAAITGGESGVIRCEIVPVRSREDQDGKGAAPTVTSAENAAESGEIELVAFIASSDPVDIDQLRRGLASRLPHYLLPRQIYQVEEIPMTINGKVDRKKLEEADRAKRAGLYSGTSIDSETRGEVDGRDERTSESAELERLERDMLAAFAQMLDRPSVRRDDDFFALGGDSLMAIQVRALLINAGHNIRARQIYEGRTVAQIIEQVKIDKNGQGEVSESERQQIAGPIPASPIQHWLFDRMRAERREGFTMTLFLESSEQVDLDILQGTLADLLNAHDGLRTVAKSNDPTVYSSIPVELEILPPIEHSDVNVRLLEVTSPGLENDDDAQVNSRIDEFIDELTTDFQFDGKTILMNAGMVRENGRDRLFLAFHHLNLDAVSLHILLEDLQQAYRAREGGVDFRTVHRGTSYSYWSRSEESRNLVDAITTEQREEWNRVREQIHLLPELFTTDSTDQSDRNDQTKENEWPSVQIMLQSDLMADVHHLEERGIERTPLMLAALGRTIHELTGYDGELPILIESNGRDLPVRTDIEQTVGWFTRVYPMLLAPATLPMIQQLEHTIQSMQRMKGREWEYLQLRYDASSNHQREWKLPQISFNYLGHVQSGAGTDVPSSQTGDQSGNEAKSIESAASRPLFRHTEYSRSTTGTLFSDIEVDAITYDGSLSIRISFSSAVPSRVAEQFEEVMTRQLTTLIRELSSGTGRTGRFITLPAVGTDRTTYLPLIRHLPLAVEGMLLELPGHGERSSDEPLLNIADIAGDIVEQIMTQLDRPFVLFGQSMGAILAYEVTRLLRQRGLPEPDLIIAAASPSPIYMSEQNKALRDGEVSEETRRSDEFQRDILNAYFSELAETELTITPTGEQQLVNPERTEMMQDINAAHADLQAMESYRYTPGENLRMPIGLMIGKGDVYLREAYSDWKKLTDAEYFQHEIDGGHTFAITHADEAVSTSIAWWQAVTNDTVSHPDLKEPDYSSRTDTVE